jgi:hypothetical protein
VLYHSFSLLVYYCLFWYIWEIVGGAKLRRDVGVIGGRDEIASSGPPIIR